jgi:uncharacterized membrane protein (DUF485 family)
MGNDRQAYSPISYEAAKTGSPAAENFRCPIVILPSHRRAKTRQPENGIVSAKGSHIVNFRMPPTASSHDDVVHSESFLRSLMRRQLALSISCAATFLVALVGMPLLNYFVPTLMATRVAGFTLTWLVLGVLFFPFVWVISWVFIKRSIALEQDEVAQAERGKERR